MRSFLVILALAAISQSGLAEELKFGHAYNHQDIAPRYTRLFEDTINETLECIRYALVTGLPEHGIPSVEEVPLEDLYLDLNELNLDGWSGYAHVRNFLLTGLTSFYASDINGDLSLLPLGYRLDITVRVQDFDISTLYEMDMIAEDMPVHGDGSIGWVMNDISFTVHAFVRLSSPIRLEDLSILVNIGSSKALITGWFNDDEHSQIFTDLFNDYLVPAWINQQPESIDQALSPLIQALINDLLAGEPETREGSILDAIMENCNVESVFKLKM